MSEELQKTLEILWTPQQVAQYLGVNKKTVYNWIAGGKILDSSKIIRFSNLIRIPRSEVERIAGSIKKDLETKPVEQL